MRNPTTQLFDVRWVVMVLVVTLLTLYSQKSFSIGKTEKGVLYGMVGTVVLQKVFEKEDSGIYFPQSSDGEFPPFRCSGDSVKCSFQRGVWERQREEWLKMKDRSYRCGRYGECDGLTETYRY